ncbi:2-oxoacid:acceptor oxidoreductase family protein [Thermodesulforhabdus norvegica]|uniref:Indolepyruvate ferredoxin oxidoreductase beta subunit n=1 Tax=Thermodesulforhabdus norvegica TaxID=39841 RepID=A0A1I4TZD1_9BACT|nr:2-oxoacid:acceptor oxidoreductase family protein [Thermodesulforhabdus norvegica]SFM81979.1 indolepyruvate ferredoxin oxidoreductase beta subunit [Thermodesulforhabdus norvegica]
MRNQIVLSGLGGQGVLFATKVLALVATGMGLGVLISETHGMAQRGGNVISHLKVFSRDEPFYGPLVRPGKADVLLAFHREGLDVHGYFLKPGGTAVCNAKDGEFKGLDLEEWKGRTLRFVDATAVALKLGNPVLSNIVLLGFAVAEGFLFGDRGLFEKVLEGIGGPDAGKNLEAFYAGLELASGR